ncbi:hypothetical protein L6164_007154 [Bauhinia variegata]|uniref:Uncharacterized protein n=1 Tax=Bauhinia variegata TaxID=167791 RepID=A0ACB9PX72_BAUVA|nr:hypothetical protein L6164_007154 [Bauhinia variegata]
MAAEPVDRITHYTKTQRIVLLIDLNPLLHLHNPSPYITSLIASAKTLLSFPPLSSSLFSFKLFFSSLSPLLSSSKLHLCLPNSSLSLSFNRPSFTLQSLSQTLNSMPQFHNPSDPAPPRAMYLATSMRQLVHDYAWDPVINDPVPDTLLNYDSISVVRSNLVVLFSPICKSLRCLSGFFNVEIGDESLENMASFSEKFSGFFKSVSDAFDCRDIHFSWVDVKCESGCREQDIEIDEIRQNRGLFESGIKALGWGFCSVDSIMLGSALVPFGLIYPKIGISFGSLDLNDYSKKIHAQLGLQILDVTSKPIEYKCCELELVNFKVLDKSDDVRFTSVPMNSRREVCKGKTKFWERFSHGITNIEIKLLLKCDAFLKIREHVSDSIFVREISRESKKKQMGNSNEFFADRVLEILAHEFGDSWQRKPVPIWQILLSFLHKEDCLALVSLSKDNGSSCMGILRPFTVSSALLSVLEDPDTVHDFGGANMAQYIKTMDSKANKRAKVIDGHQKKTMPDLNTIQNLTWSAFCESAYDHFELDLHECYFAMECKELKKLKFLKCWMKQMKKSGFCDLAFLEKLKPDSVIPQEINDRLTNPLPDGEQPISSSASVGENTMIEVSRIQEDAVLEFRSETSETFFTNLPNKINQGIESEVVDLGALAERLVNSSIYWLYQRFDGEGNSESETALTCNNARGGMVAAELINLLLREPKELAAKHKSSNPFSQASDPGLATLTTEHIVREYELQILFRLEILQSEVGSGVQESSKQKFVKQICLLLENIQCHMEGGFFGDWNLDNYASKIIKSRYSNTLGDVVHRIYSKMDLLVFADEDEDTNSLLKSEDSNGPWKGKADSDEMGENNVNDGPVSAKNEPFQPLNNDSGRHQRMKQLDHDQKISEAKERRERARRFHSFTSWMPDLQRVWAPKQKAMKPKSDPFRKLSKRKERQRTSYDTVCETPMTGNKRSCQMTSDTDDDSYPPTGSQTSGSVSKALFQDDLSCE